VKKSPVQCFCFTTNRHLQQVHNKSTTDRSNVVWISTCCSAAVNHKTGHSITVWLIGRLPQFWTENLTKVLGGSKKQYIFGKRDDDPWTGTRAATRWATRTTDFLPRRISIVARTGRRTEQASSDEDAGLWQRPKRQGKSVGCVWNNSFIIGHSNEHINRTYDVRYLRTNL